MSGRAASPEGAFGGVEAERSSRRSLEELSDSQRRFLAALCQAGGGRVGRALRTLLD